MFFLYYFCYGTSFAKVPWVYTSEINSLTYRIRGAAASTATNWLGGFVVTQFTKVGVDNLGWRFYLMFAVFVYSYFPVVMCLYPETSRRTLEDMDEIFARDDLGILVWPDRNGKGNELRLRARERPGWLAQRERQRVEQGRGEQQTAG